MSSINSGCYLLSTDFVAVLILDILAQTSQTSPWSSRHGRCMWSSVVTWYSWSPIDGRSPPGCGSQETLDGVETGVMSCPCFRSGMFQMFQMFQVV